MNTEVLKKLKDNISRVVIGNEKTIQLVLTALVAKGHILLEDVPGTGKTVLAKSLAKSVEAEFGRVQFTPDLLPSDVTGLNFYDAKSGEFRFNRGPAFCNILLADEINRATPKTQSALLECMAERQITVDGTTYPLTEPYLVIATENPLETLGTFPLPEAQLDRFLFQISMEDMTVEQELALLERFMTEEPLETLSTVCSREDICALQEACRNVYVHPELKRYLVDVVQATRKHSKVAGGVSPRGTLSFIRAAQGYAMVQGREYVVPEDIKAVAVPALAHRIVMNVTVDSGRAAVPVIEEILSSVALPTEKWDTIL